ncbi:SLC13 family permease [Streptomyces sp. NBC_00006]|uniref:SLC13 family permease n=1 Tax=Streptomyces sp. NBC_00006 TaxID=2975619 RepID=UPI0022554333|nr:SLC13 family permease [Streptomyces sp. NBC_00006]MCX5537485.1 SLC13 family permease [Streptomyces sp. NBC_00006]
MSDQVISIIGLVLVFVIATFTKVHMGVIAIVAAFVVGTAVAGESADELFAGFPGDLFVVLVGVTLLFAIAKNNGTVDWLVQASTRAVRGRIALIPWVMFLITGALTASGAVVPGAVGIMAPIGMGFAVRHKINPILMGLLIINGASAGGFSPISIFGTITNGVVQREDLPGSEGMLFLTSFLFNLALSVVVFFLFGGRKLLGRRAEVPAGAPGEGGGAPADTTGGGTPAASVPAPAGERVPSPTPAGGPEAAPTPTSGQLTAPTAAPPKPRPPAPDTEEILRLDPVRALTVLGVISLALGSLAFDLDVGLMAFVVSAVLCLVSPASAKGAVERCAWPTVLLVCGIVMYVSLMDKMGTIKWAGESVSDLGTPLVSALLICVIGGVVSAFASTTGILGALIPLAVPFLAGGEIGAIGMISALAISSSVVDSSPFSTSGALTVASAPEEMRDTVFRRLMAWGLSMTVIAPLATWVILVIPGQL